MKEKEVKHTPKRNAQKIKKEREREREREKEKGKRKKKKESHLKGAPRELRFFIRSPSQIYFSLP